MNDRKRKSGVELTRPPRWLHCPRKGAIIAEKFIPFKTPLDDKYADQVPEECTFTPDMMIASLSSYKVKMGLWIDLTNTTRFYDRNIVDECGVKYVKLHCKGHGECPSIEMTRGFIEFCQRFISKNPLEVIGVHCTHGYNRTGFLIAAYLVESLSWSIEAAVDAFRAARPPGIYKQDYLIELFKRYGEIEDAPPPPPLPDWCNEEEDNVTDDGVPLNIAEPINPQPKPQHKRRREFIKMNPTFMPGVPGVMAVLDPDLVDHVQRVCQEMCEWKGSGFPGSQPVSMDCNNINYLHHRPYRVSWKADGTRYMMLIEGENRIFFIDRDNSVFKVSHLTFPRRKVPGEHVFDTLLDGEMIIDKIDGIECPRYLAYDIIKFEGVDVGKTDFERRRLCIKKEIVGARTTAIEEGRLDRSREPFGIRLKEFYDITLAHSLLGERFRKEVSHDVDGLIFQPVIDPYIPGRCEVVLKWKPSELNSVDFKLVIGKITGEGMLPTLIGYLYVGGCPVPYGQIKITKALKALDKKIIECKFENKEWVFMRERTDKSFPNSKSTADGVCQSILQPVTKDKLFDFIHKFRWVPPPSKQHQSQS